MDLRRLARMTIGGLACLLIGAVSLIAIYSLLYGVADGTTRLEPWIGVLILGVLSLETFVLTVAGLILLIWALVAAIAGPPVVETAAAEESGRKHSARPTPENPARTVPGPVTPTAMLDPGGGVSRLDPQKRRPPHQG